MVAPISAPMLQMVALPVALMADVPGPKYSTMAPVPPLTVRIWATLRMTSLGEVQPDSWPVRRTPTSERPPQAEGAAGHHVDRVGPAHADGDHAQAAGVGRVAVGADHHPAGEGVALEHDLVDDPRTRLPEADAVLGRDARQEVVDLPVGLLGREQVGDGAHLGQDEVVAVDGGGHAHPGQSGGGELEQGHLGGGVLHGHPVGLQLDVGLSPLEGGDVGRRGRRPGARRGSSRPG